jgi:hypothetical protein
MRYIFIDKNNGHYRTYHPFEMDRVITQEQADKIMKKIPGVGRLGVSISTFLDVLYDEGMNPSIYKCKCCNQIVTSIKDDNPYFRDWERIEGICGNY